MKTNFLFCLCCLCLALVAKDEPEKLDFSDKGNPTTGSIALTIQPARYIIFAIGKGSLRLDCSTGEVKLPEDMELSETATAFWKAIAAAFPDVRRQIVKSDPGHTELLKIADRLCFATEKFTAHEDDTQVGREAIARLKEYRIFIDQEKALNSR